MITILRVIGDGMPNSGELSILQTVSTYAEAVAYLTTAPVKWHCDGIYLLQNGALVQVMRDELHNPDSLS